MPGKIYVATETFSSAYVSETIHEGVTRVREGHILLEMHPDYFTPVADQDEVHFDSERGPVAPAKIKEPEPVEPEPELAPADEPEYEHMTRRQLESVAEEVGVDNPSGLPNKAALIKAITAAGQ
jgi:hypothetical protein